MKTYLIKTDRGYLAGIIACCEHCLNYKLDNLYYLNKDGNRVKYKILDVYAFGNGKAYLFFESPEPYVIYNDRHL